MNDLTGWRAKVREKYQALLQSTVGLLAPSACSCLLCGSEYRIPAASGAAMETPVRLNGLCPACTASVPWIQRVACPVCGRPERCGDCSRRQNGSFVCSRSAVRYDTFIRELLALYKYRGHEALAPLLGTMLQAAYAAMRTELGRRRKDFGFDLLVPVPVSDERLLERGFNQAERLAAELAARSGVSVFELLRRSWHSGKQSFKSRGDRLRDTRRLFVSDDEGFNRLEAWLLNGRKTGKTGKADGTAVTAFGETESSRLAAAAASRSVAALCTEHVRSILIVDDIYTTGGTVDACAAALAEGFRQRYGGFAPEIYVLTLARS